jgi:hypothetical protein
MSKLFRYQNHNNKFSHDRFYYYKKSKSYKNHKNQKSLNFDYDNEYCDNDISFSFACEDMNAEFNDYSDYYYDDCDKHSDDHPVSVNSSIEKIKVPKKTLQQENKISTESKKTLFLSHIIVITLFTAPFAFYAYDYNPVFTYIIASVVGFFLFSLGIHYTKRILKFIFSRPNKRIKLELKNTSQLLTLISKESNLTNNLTLSQKMHDQITINDLLIENVDKLSTIDLVVNNQKLKNALSAIDDNCVNEMKVIL